MQISTEQVELVLQKTARGARDRAAERPVGSVEELAAKHGVDMEEVRRFTESALMAEVDPHRERRIRELAERVERGAYQVEAEDVVDMARRRAVADRASEL